MTPKKTILFLCLAISLTACGDKDNFLEGSLADQYDLEFDSVEATQYIGARQLLIEYLRGDEKPIRLTIIPTPEGPGTFSHDEGEVAVDNSLAPGSPELPDLTSATVDLVAFTPEEADTNVEGSLGAMFTTEGLGTAFSLEGNFKTPLKVAP